ncbi:extracellular superoxide dismutase [Cu-Zn] [Rhinatrema bivittatum]|uniref:extracellular superoxide dismutase [Cu-Zn] n=1 Tax=Rhinatrema bivittatum TaxID=194408 RepID=UPI00112EF3A9|nr:extracellular superoxide dismutase [Cu-Zn] [Rhinatrema bivittatum]
MPPSLCLVAFLYFSPFCLAGGEDGNFTDEEQLKDIWQKVNDMWLNLLPPQAFKSENERTAYATCELRPSSKLEADEPIVTGQALFKQTYPHGKLEAIFYLQGFPTTGNESGRAIHIHELGDLSEGCDSTKGHYNPFTVNHPHHPGDFGNFITTDGKIRKRKANLQAMLFGPHSILGRSVVVHKQEDDLGKGNNPASVENGNAGKRLACCVIGISSNSLWAKAVQTLATEKSLRLGKLLKNKEVPV